MTNEILERLKAAAAPEELMELAKENGAALTPEDAQKLFETLQDPNARELSDEELEQASGGIWLFWRK